MAIFPLLEAGGRFSLDFFFFLNMKT
jgi:hypothetical protein